MNNLAKKPDVEAIMERIRREAKSAASQENGRAPRIRSRAPQCHGGQSTPLLYTDELNYLNANWHNWGTASEVSSHRPLIGPIIVRLKKFLLNVVWNNLLRDYFEREKVFQMNLVRFLNANARYIEARDAEIFWRVIGKLDEDIQASNNRVDQLFDETSGSVEDMGRSIEKRLAKLENSIPRASQPQSVRVRDE